MSAPASPGALRLATAGIAVVGVCFGMARYGYGLLLPDVRREYGLSPAVLGTVAMASYVAYLAATALAGAVARAHARRTAIAAGLTAATGMALAGLSQSPAVFIAGVLIAGASAGIAFAPFADAARAISPAARGRVLAAISCGTGYGVALAAPIAIVAGTSWRSAWLAFACTALGATWWAARVLPRDEPGRLRDDGAASWASVVCRRSLPLLAGAVLIGVGSAAYWTFAVDYLVDAGALSATASRSFLGVVGVASVLATLSGDLLGRLGPAPTYRLAACAEGGAVALLAVAPASVAAAIASGVLFGAAYNGVLAIQAIWATHLFAARPSLGIAAVMAANGAGFVIGPVAAGLLAGPLGLGVVLLLGAGVIAGAGLLAPREAILPREDVRPRSAASRRRDDVRRLVGDLLQGVLRIASNTGRFAQDPSQPEVAGAELGEGVLGGDRVQAAAGLELLEDRDRVLRERRQGLRRREHADAAVLVLHQRARSRRGPRRSSAAAPPDARSRRRPGSPRARRRAARASAQPSRRRPRAARRRRPGCPAAGHPRLTSRPTAAMSSSVRSACSSPSLPSTHERACSSSRPSATLSSAAWAAEICVRTSMQ